MREPIILKMGTSAATPKSDVPLKLRARLTIQYMGWNVEQEVQKQNIYIKRKWLGYLLWAQLLREGLYGSAHLETD